VWSTMSFDHVLVILGRFVQTGEDFPLFNVYAPCDANRQQVLWNNLSNRLGFLSVQNVCVCGDFNVVRCSEERPSCGAKILIILLMVICWWTSLSGVARTRGFGGMGSL